MNSTQPVNEIPANDCSCHAFCPVCGADLYFRDKECICKNKECSWTCSECHKS